MKDPAVLFYPSDFLIGTMFMKDEDIGRYIKLLCIQHQKGRLTKEQMYSVTNGYNEDVFSKFIQDNNELYYNERMENEIKKRAKYSESRRKNAKGKKKSTKETPVKVNMTEEVLSSKADYYLDITQSVVENLLTDNQKKLRLFNLKNELLSTGFNLDAVSRAINKETQETIEYIERYIEHISGTGEYCNALKTIRIHCTNWIKLQIKKDESTTKKTEGWSGKIKSMGESLIAQEKYSERID